MKLLRPLAGYTLYDHKTKDYIRRELRITGILDKLEEYRRNWFQHLQTHIKSHKTDISTQCCAKNVKQVNIVLAAKLCVRACV